jgi:hypothetical protein
MNNTRKPWRDHCATEALNDASWKPMPKVLPLAISANADVAEDCEASGLPR